LGSNIFNMTLVGGLSAIVSPLVIVPASITLSLPFMLMLTVALFIFLRSGWRIKRHEGAVLLSIYLVFLYFLLFRPL
jgi:cation:H+ antiporter